MRVVRLSLLLAVVVVAAVAHSAAAGVAAPASLHGFLLRANEPATTTFSRTPSFAWRPVSGALRYEFQLSTSSAFRDNGVLYDDATLTTPVASPPLTLPWITGSPHALYARVRALTAGGASPWSVPFGFDVLPPAPPAPLPSYPGLLRWSPVEGANAYQVWLLDAHKTETVRTNVLDEREFYTFHSSQAWIETVHWRVRALRTDVYGNRINGIPAAQSGAWSPVYTSTNPAFANAPLTLVGTVSTTVSDGGASSAAHETTPGFVWSGDETQAGTPSGLFRVEVFTDSQCLNLVYTSAVVGSPAYAPRLGGPLALPTHTQDVPAAQASYLADGTEQSDLAYDGTVLTPNEQLPPATPTTAVGADLPAADGTAPATGTSGGTTPATGGAATGSSGSASSSGSATTSPAVGPPVDLWDVNWPSSGYYWTVIPVEADGATPTKVANPGAATGDKVLPLESTAGFAPGDSVTIGIAPAVESGTVIAVSPGSITLAQPLAHDHLAGEGVYRQIRYYDMELPQDVCAAGRVQRFGVASAPSLTTAEAPFATGLSATGRLVSAVHSTAFYGAPLVAWTPAPNASVYEVQWSKARYPFVAQVDARTQKQGYLTYSTSAVLPLGAGTWWYRVRGFDYNLPTGVQQMSWSEPQKLVVAAPKFKVTKVATKKRPKFRVVGATK